MRRKAWVYTLLMWGVCLLALSLTCVSNGQVKLVGMKPEYEQGEAIVLELDMSGVPEGAVVQPGFRFAVTTAAKKYEIKEPATKCYYMWGSPGAYELTAIGMWGVPVPNEPGKWLSFGMIFEQVKLTVKGGSVPDPVVNPYQPAPAYQAAVGPVKALSLAQADGRALAAMYAEVAKQARAGAYLSLGAIRAELVKRGQSLNLKGKYAGLSPAVEAYLTATIGLQEAVPAETVGDVFETLAWAVFAAGRA